MANSPWNNSRSQPRRLCGYNGSFRCGWILPGRPDLRVYGLPRRSDRALSAMLPGLGPRASGHDPALMPAPAAMRDHVLRVITQRARLKVGEVADKGEVRVRPPEEFSSLVRIGGPAGRVM